MTELSDAIYLDAERLIDGYKNLDFTPREVVQAFLERVDADAEVNAISETVDSALRDADEAGARYLRWARGSGAGSLPSLLGVPVAAKEKHALEGLTLSQGLVGLRDEIATEDHPIIERLKASGAIIHARTTTPEFSCATVTHSALWGITRNPWNPDYSPGGSSGGSAAALAAAFTTLATASDIAGSTRVPAGFTGTFGYKPPYGRIPGTGSAAADWYRSDGPMGRSVDDLVSMLGIIAGIHRADHSSIPNSALRDIRSAEPRGLRVGYLPGYRDYRSATRVTEAMEAVAAHLAEAGSEVVEVETVWDSGEVVDLAFGHFGSILAPAMRDEVARSGVEPAPYTSRFIEDAAFANSRSNLHEMLVRERDLQLKVHRMFDDLDVLICPTSCIEQLDAAGNYIDGVAVGGARLDHYWQSHFTLPFNIANRCPVVAMPTGIVSDAGIPIGMQIVGRPFDERSVFEAAYLIEELLGVGVPRAVEGTIAQSTG